MSDNSKKPLGHDHYATGKRKNAIARVFLRSGSGKITVNGKKLEDYFCRETSRMIAQQALVATEHSKDLDLLITVKGGGESGQAGAVRHGIARGIAKMNADLKAVLRAAKPDLITRDSRIVERKKVALRGARRAPQYSKR